MTNLFLFKIFNIVLPVKNEGKNLDFIIPELKKYSKI